MKLKTICIIILFIVSGSVFSQKAIGMGYNQPIENKAFVDMLHENKQRTAVVQACYDLDGCFSGSGWLAQGGHVITAAHILDHNNQLPDRVMIWYGGDITRTYATGYSLDVIDINYDLDIALLKILISDEQNDEFLKGLGYFSLAKTVEENEQVLSIGHPAGLHQYSYTEGYVQKLSRSIRDADNGKIMNVTQLRMESNKGNSGGPIIDQNGDVVGMVWGSASQDHFTSYAVSLDQLRDFFIKNGLPTDN